jgi:hypothetical protein
MEKLYTVKHSRLLIKWVNYGHKKFYNIAPTPTRPQGAYSENLFNVIFQKFLKQ